MTPLLCFRLSACFAGVSCNRPFSAADSVGVGRDVVPRHCREGLERLPFNSLLIRWFPLVWIDQTVSNSRCVRWSDSQVKRLFVCVNWGGRATFSFVCTPPSFNGFVNFKVQAITSQRTRRSSGGVFSPFTLSVMS
jgi:hypothetical protein